MTDISNADLLALFFAGLTVGLVVRVVVSVIGTYR